MNSENEPKTDLEENLLMNLTIEGQALRCQKDTIHSKDGLDKDFIRRWVVFFALASLNLGGGFGWTMYDAVPEYSESHFNVDNETLS